MNEPTPKITQDQITAFFNDRNVTDQIGYLWGRYQDEKEYEDIKDYQAALPPFPIGWTVVKMSARPFGFQFKIDSLPNNVYSYFVTSRQCGWKRIK